VRCAVVLNGSGVDFQSAFFRVVSVLWRIENPPHCQSSTLPDHPTARPPQYNTTPLPIQTLPFSLFCFPFSFFLFA